jgi:hypothetical protein
MSKKEKPKSPKLPKPKPPMTKEEVRRLTHRTAEEFARDENMWK